MRKIRFATGEFYHIYNRGVDKRSVFLDSHDFERFLQSMREFNSQKPIGSLFENSFRDKTKLGNRVAKLVDVVSYCLNNNHYHLMLRQRIENGISGFMHRLGTGYTQSFNIKYKRSGSLFQGKFKALHIHSNEYFLHLSAYINLNNKVHRIKGESFRSSWKEYVDDKDDVCFKSIILEQFNKPSEYKEFAESSLQDILGRKKIYEEMKEMLLE
ncbi:MAG: transposase [Candidatus Giovannonibacteria bacterium]|nr:MAG: transposase [Candidatus Giovannonibacteria bacterium]